MVDGRSQLGVVSGLDDVVSGGCLVLDVGLLKDLLRLPTEWVVDAGADVNVVGVQGLLGSERRSLAIRELDHHRGSKGQEGLGRVLVEDGLGLVEGPVRSDGSVEGGLSCVVELVGDESLELEDSGRVAQRGQRQPCCR